MECTADDIDGSYDDCGCDECTEAWYDDIDRGVESGSIDEDEAHDKVAQFEQFGVR